MLAVAVETHHLLNSSNSYLIYQFQWNIVDFTLNEMGILSQKR